MALKAPFPYFGGKSSVADIVWRHFGNPKMYVEPFCGSAAILLARPGVPPFHKEIINDFDGNVANFWRAMKYDPNGVADVADWPTNHIDLMARKRYVLKEYDSMREKLIADPEYCDPKIAGYWVWILSNEIGTPFISLNQRPHITHCQGIVTRKNLCEHLKKLQKRLADVKVVCGDWMQVMGGNWRTANGDCAVFLDPPYAPEQGRKNNIYRKDDLTTTHDVLKWCKENGDNRLYKIALCGYDGEHNELENMGWTFHAWKANGGYANTGRDNSRGKENKFKERVWFSPFCNRELTLF
jgi:DNA adenine methylase